MAYKAFADIFSLKTVAKCVWIIVNVVLKISKYCLERTEMLEAFILWY